MHVIKAHKSSLIPPWTPVLLHYSHDCTTWFSTRVNGTVIKPISSSSEEKNHDMCHSWMRNSHSRVTGLHLLGSREPSVISYVFKTIPSPPQCPTDTSKWVVQKFGFQLPSETYPTFGRQDTCKCVLVHTCMPTYMHTGVCKHKDRNKCTGLVQSCAVPQPPCSVFSSQWLFSGIL